MRDVDASGADRTVVAVLVQYGMATTEQLHLLLAPGERIGQTRRRLAQLRAEGVVDRIAVGRAGRARVWFPTPTGARLAGEWPELLGRRPSRRRALDRGAVRARASHALTVNEVALAFVQDARTAGSGAGAGLNSLGHTGLALAHGAGILLPAVAVVDQLAVAELRDHFPGVALPASSISRTQ